MLSIDEKYSLALDARLNSYSPYSNFKVGALCILENDTVIKGCNVENMSYGLTNCAERTCLFSAVADGVKKEDIVAFCVYTKNETLASPCGACRQVMEELLPTDCKIYIAYGKDVNIYETSMKELLPLSFSSEDLK